MRPFTIALGMLAAWSALAADASAAWNNVFQPTLFHRRRTTAAYYAPPVVAYSAPVVAAAAPCCPAPAPAPCPQQCSTSYIQRCYYQPVTTYQQQTYYEPVTTYRTSYYHEPVTSYRYSCYYDPCTCSYKQVATPVVSYALRAQTCPVQSWVQRCASVPVTTYQKSCYLQPQTTCCQTTTGPLIPTAAVGVEANGYLNGGVNGGAAVAVPQQPFPQQPYPQQPPQIQVTPPQSSAPPTIRDIPPSGPNVGNMSLSQPPRFPTQPPGGWQAAPVQNRPAAPPVKLERIVFGPESYVEGQIVRGDNTPGSGASVLFVSAQSGQRHTATANAAGRFQINLASGSYLVYVPGRDGTPLFHSRVSVANNQPTRLSVVN
jgi:hypothetical protein